MINTERLCLGCMNDNGGEKICPVCGYDSTQHNPSDCLPTKFVIKNRYYLGKVVSINGEGITYIAWDKANDAVVSVKEYFPKGFAHRNPDKTVSIISGGEYTFNEGLLEFMEINKVIMDSDLPALIPVIDVFEENGTVFAVSENIQGITLEKFLEKNGGILKWGQVRALFLPLIDTIKGMNDLGIIHRGISAQTIIASRDGKFRITDYRIRKQRLDNSEQESELYAGYSPIELYGFEDMHDDTYTDVYGISAVLFRVLIGNVPAAATVRIQNDAMSIPARFAEELPRHVLASLANGLQVLPEKRTRDIETFKNELVYGEINEAKEVKRPSKKATAEEEVEAPKKKKGGSAKYAVISAVSTALVFAVIAAVLVFGVFRDEIFPPKEDPNSSEEVIIDAPEVDNLGDIESGAEVTAKQYSVPDLKGKFYQEIIENDDYEMFEFVISDKAEFSQEVEKGAVCGQSVAAGTQVVRDTKIELVLSLGKKEVKVANVIGLDEINAKLELLKQGFLYQNIEVLEKYDEEKEPGVVVDQQPKYNEEVNTNTSIKIYINSYKGNENLEGTSSER
ncbi:MAG: PASTA domain-containing protein [Ruminococcaceae bacterium]|nr:PASTA domain-containing protein [Oscillospiraceae bacterium]